MKKISVLNHKIQEAIQNATNNSKGSLQEPDYCAAIAIELPKLINSARAFPGVTFSGCFIHQSPKATFHASNTWATCELGDLLAVCHNIVDGDDRYNAALVQWKIIKSGKETISGTALNQLDLYEHWPAFSLNSNSKQYDIYPKTATPGAQYGIIKLNAQYPLNIMIPSKELKYSESISFARFLINFMKWQTGRPFFLDQTNSSDEWSLLISDLIKNSLTKVFNRNRTGYINTPRASKDLLQLLEQDKTAQYNNDDNNNESISILYIDIAESKA